MRLLRTGLNPARKVIRPSTEPYVSKRSVNLPGKKSQSLGEVDGQVAFPNHFTGAYRGWWGDVSEEMAWSRTARQPFRVS